MLDNQVAVKKERGRGEKEGIMVSTASFIRRPPRSYKGVLTKTFLVRMGSFDMAWKRSGWAWRAQFMRCKPRVRGVEELAGHKDKGREEANGIE